MSFMKVYLCLQKVIHKKKLFNFTAANQREQLSQSLSFDDSSQVKNKQNSSGWAEAGKYQKQLKDAARVIDNLVLENATL